MAGSNNKNTKDRKGGGVSSLESLTARGRGGGHTFNIVIQMHMSFN